MKSMKKQLHKKHGKTKKQAIEPNPYVKAAARKISIPIDWNASDGGYSSLYSERVFDFLVTNVNKGYNLIQTQPGKHFKAKGKTVLHLQAIREQTQATSYLVHDDLLEFPPSPTNLLPPLRLMPQFLILQC